MSQGLAQETESTLGISNRERFNTENQVEAYKIDGLEGQKSGVYSWAMSSRAHHSSYVPEVRMVLLPPQPFTPMKLVTRPQNRT